MIIYKIQNKINGKIYIGQTKYSVGKRIVNHFKQRYPIGAALRKYGLQSFEVTIIDSAESLEIINEKEKYWIKNLGSKQPKGYNIADGGGGVTGVIQSEESNQKRSLKLKGRPSPMKGRTSAMKGKQMTEEQKAPMRKPKGEQGRKNMSDKAKQVYAEGRGSFNKINGKGNKYGWQKGDQPWNTGLTKETDPRIAEMHKDGKSEEIRKKISETRKSLHIPSPMKDKHHTQESRKRMGDTRRARKIVPWNKGIKQKDDIKLVVNE